MQALKERSKTHVTRRRIPILNKLAIDSENSYQEACKELTHLTQIIQDEDTFVDSDASPELSMVYGKRDLRTKLKKKLDGIDNRANIFKYYNKKRVVHVDDELDTKTIDVNATEFNHLLDLYKVPKNAIVKEEGDTEGVFVEEG